MAERWFTEDELAKMGQRTVDAIQQAIDAGDHERAKGLSRRMYREFSAMHDLLRDWIGGMLSFVGRDYGDEALAKAIEAGCGMWLRPLADAYAKAEPKRRAEMLVAGFRGHLQPIVVEEDDEKVTLVLGPCGSGGRLVLDGSYSPPRNLLKVEQPQPFTFGRANFPVYCTHCLFQEMVPMQYAGKFLFITEPAENIGAEACRIHLYKRDEDIPAKYYERIGKTKPVA